MRLLDRLRLTAGTVSALLFFAGASVAPLSAQSIFRAARDGDLATVRKLVARNRSLAVNGDADGLTPLHWAAAWGRTEVVAYLLDHGAGVDARDRRSSNAIRAAADEQSAPPTPEGEEEGGGIAVSVAVPESPSDPPDAATPLHWAAACGHREAARLLLDRGATVDARNGFMWTPLHYAAQYGHADIVELLAKRGAALDAETMPDYTPLLYAATCDWPEKGAEAMRALLRAGADPRHGERRGARTLEMAANHGNIEGLRILLDAGADPNIPDENGQTPMHEAANVLEPVEPMRILLAHGAEPDIVDSLNECTPLLYLRAGGLEAVKLLLDAGARTDRRSKNGDTPLHNVAEFDSGAALRLLLQRGLDPNARGYEGKTPLHLAAGAYHGNAGAIAALIGGGADVNARDSSGRTPLHHAALRGNEEVVRALLDNGAEKVVLDNAGDTPFAYAMRGRNPAVVKLLKVGR